jgi:hypothetical protein
MRHATRSFFAAWLGALAVSSLARATLQIAAGVAAGAAGGHTLKLLNASLLARRASAAKLQSSAITKSKILMRGDFVRHWSSVCARGGATDERSSGLQQRRAVQKNPCAAEQN